MITKIETTQTIEEMGIATVDDSVDWCDFITEELPKQYPDAEISVKLDNSRGSSTLYVECDADDEGYPTDPEAKNTVREYINYLWEQWC